MLWRSWLSEILMIFSFSDFLLNFKGKKVNVCRFCYYISINVLMNKTLMKENLSSLIILQKMLFERLI